MQLPTNSFKTLLAKNTPLFGIWASFPSAATVEALTHSTYDWMLIDAEHSPLSIDCLHSQLQAAANGPCAVVVRPVCAEQQLMKRMLDLGVQSFMLPMIESAAHARAAVAYTRYPPGGVRGIAGATRASRYGRVDGYLQTAHTQIALVAQIETPAALEQIEAIGAVDGIDALFIGPNDLAATMGYPGELKHPVVTAAIDRAIVRIRSTGKAAGILVSTVEDAAHCVDQGVRMIACGSDVRLLTRAADEMGRRLKGLREPTLDLGKATHGNESAGSR